MQTGFNQNEALEFIKNFRSNEANFDSLYQKMQQLLHDSSTPGDIKSKLEEAKTKADNYKAAKEKGASSWADFEKFVTDFEKAVLEVN